MTSVSLCGRVERKDGETLLEDVREVLKAFLVVAMRRGTSAGGEAGEGSGDGRADAGQDGRAAVDAGPILLLDLLANDLDGSGETHSSVLLSGRSHESRRLPGAALANRKRHSIASRISH